MIGDAAHATSPFMAQGANQAIQDGYLIGRLLSENGEDFNAAFENLYKIRHPVTAKIVSNSKSIGEIRTGTGVKSRLIRMGMRNFLHYAPTKLLQKVMVDNFYPTFLKK